jgi:hypothetical protein
LCLFQFFFSFPSLLLSFPSHLTRAHYLHLQKRFSILMQRSLKCENTSIQFWSLYLLLLYSSLSSVSCFLSFLINCVFMYCFCYQYISCIVIIDLINLIWFIIDLIFISFIIVKIIKELHMGRKGSWFSSVKKLFFISDSKKDQVLILH